MNITEQPLQVRSGLSKQAIKPRRKQVVHNNKIPRKIEHHNLAKHHLKRE